MSGRARRTRGLAIALASLASCLLGFGIASRWSDGPVGPVPGGPFSSGRASPGMPDPGRLRDQEVVQLEVGAPGARSVLLGVVVWGDEIFVPTTLAPVKGWDELVERAPGARMRFGREIFAGRLEPVSDPRLHRELFEAAQRKYGRGLYFGAWAADLTKFFRWKPAR